MDTSPLIASAVAPEAIENLLSQGIDYEKERQRIWELCQVAENKSSTFHSNLSAYRDDYFLRSSGDINPDADDLEKARVSDLRQMVDLAASILCNADFRVFLDRMGDDQEDKRKAGIIERWVKQVLENSRRRTGIDVRQRAVHYTLSLGLAALHWVWSDDPFPMGNRRRQGHVPIEIFVVDPKNISPILWRGGQLKYVCHTEKQSLEDAYSLVEITLGGDPEARKQLDKHFREVRLSDRHQREDQLRNYWGWEWLESPCLLCAADGASALCPMCGGQSVTRFLGVVNAILYGNALLRPATPMEGYRQLPWALAACQDNGEPDYEDRWLPLTYAARPHVRAVERDMSLYTAILTNIANMPFRHKVGVSGQASTEVVGGLNNVMPLNADEEFEAPNYGRAPADLLPHLQMNQERAWRAGFAPEMYGISGAGGPASGYSFDSLQEGGRLKLVHPRNGLASAFEQMVVGIMDLTAYYAGDQIIYSAQVRPPGMFTQPTEEVRLLGSDLENWDEVSVQWKSDLPGDEMRKTAQMVQIKGSRVAVPDEWLMERFLNAEDPWSLRQTWLAELVEQQHPKLLEMRAWDVMQSQNRFPRFGVAEQAKLGLEMADIHAQMLAAGASEQEAEEAVYLFQMGVRQSLEQKYGPMALQMMQMMRAGMGMPGAPGAPGGGEGAPQPSLGGEMGGFNTAGTPVGGEPEPGASPKGAPRVGPEQGLASYQEMGAPAGNPMDPGRDLAAMANSVRGNVGQT